MPNTILNEHPYPSENQDPHYSTLSNFYNLQDTTSWMNKIRSNMILAGGGILVWDSGTSLLSWTSNFAIKHLTSGFLVEFVYGPDDANREATIVDGQIVYGIVRSSISESQTENLKVVDKLDKTDNNFVLAWRYGNNLYFQNGIVL